MRDPREEPREMDILHKWDQAFLVTRNTQGCVYTQPSLSAHRDWVGILFFRDWAKNADVRHVAGEK